MIFNNFHRDSIDDLFSISQDKDKLLNDLPKFQKILENIIENLISKENEEENFLIFCENNTLERIIEITNFKEKKINLIVIKVFSILIPNLKNKKLEYYLFSNNYMNQIISNISYNNKEDDIDYLSFYINFLKTLANKIDLNSFHLFFNRNYQRFPLLDELIIFLNYDKDIMIKNTSRNIFLTLLKLNYKPFIEYICDLPTITLFILFSENLKNKFIYFCKTKDNSKSNNNTILISNDNNKSNVNNNINLYNEIEENKETLADDISFIQDILSINVPKINYLLINTLFYISLKYLFNNILLRQNADVSFFILNLFLEIIKNQAIKNIIIFILYFSQIQINIIEIVANDEILDIYRLLDLNKYVFSDISIESEKDKLSFDDYIILNYSSRFLNSLRYIKDNDNIYTELKDISRQLNKSDDLDNEIKISIKLLNKKIKRINFVLKQIEQYHNFISKATGINVGVSINSASHSFLQIIHNNYKENLSLQDNIFKNECMHYCTNLHLSQYLCVINEMFLINKIIKDEDISKGLKFKLNLMTDFSKINNNEISSVEKLDENKNNIDQNFDTPPPASFRFNSVNSYSKFYENKNNIYKNFFGEKDNDIYLSSFLSLPNIINDRTDITSYDSNINLIVDNKILSYKEMDLNNEFFDKILSYYKSTSELLILEKLINLLLERKKTLNKISYKLIIDIINDLLSNGNNICQINEDIKKRINEQYRQLLQIINDLLEKSTLDEQVIDEEYFYEFFENCFYWNKKDISEIKKNYINSALLIINEENLKDYNNKIGLDLMKIPNEKYQMLKCLFQKFISLHDLKIIVNSNDKKDQNLIMKYQKFPLNFFDVSEFNDELDEKTLLEKLNVDLFILKYKTDKDLSFENGILSVYKNMLLLFKNKNSLNKEINNNNLNKKNDINNNINDGSDNNIYILDKLIPLRKIKINETVKKEFDKSKYLILNILYNDTQFQLILLIENEKNFLNIKDIIAKEIINGINAEYSLLKSYFKALLDNDVLDPYNV